MRGKTATWVDDPKTVRVAIVAETFLPQMNGVVGSLLKAIEHITERGYEALVIAPGTRMGGPREYMGVPIVYVPSLAFPAYKRLRVAPGGVARIRRILADFAPDVVHIASPFLLGWRAVQACQELNIPSVAVYQTEVPAYAARYGLTGVESMLWGHVRNIHNRATMTLAPSTPTIEQLESHGVDRIAKWARGVDAARFHPNRRCDEWRQSVAGGKKVIGYVGRLAAEKQVENLRVLADVPDAKIVIIGEGPLMGRLRTVLPNAHFTGFLGGEALARAVAGFDLCIAPGEFETFCQTIQEAMASGVPVIAPARGGPLDLVDHSRTGWLYAPGDVAGLRDRALDLLGDDAKRRAFAQAARAEVESRTWRGVCSQLVGYYAQAIAAHENLAHSR